MERSRLRGPQNPKKMSCTQHIAPKISVSNVSERDLDLLLLEEFVASPQFRGWFVSTAITGATSVEACLSARRSVTQSIGQSDLEILFRTVDGGRLLVMIENKVKAGFQPLQAERYRARAVNYVQRGDCEQALSIITAPKSYFGGSESCKGFDGRVSYEDILQWFIGSSESGARLAYKEALLQAAINKSSLGYQPVEDAVATRFWRDYWEMVRVAAPELRMPEPGVKTAGSTFISFKPSGLPLGADIVHKLTGTKGSITGFVDLQFPGMGELVLELGSSLKGLLEHGMSVARVTKSAAVRIAVPLVDPNKEAVPQVDEIKAGLAAAMRLHRWLYSSSEVEAAIRQVALHIISLDAKSAAE